MDLAVRFAYARYLHPSPVFAQEKPYELWTKDADAVPLAKTNCEFEAPAPVPVHDSRTATRSFALDDCGFEFVHLPFPEELTMPRIRSAAGPRLIQDYVQFVIKQVRARFAAERVICFDWRYRSAEDFSGAADSENRFNVLKPASVIHIDESALGGLMRVRGQVGDAALREYLASGMRVRIINVWRPLVSVVQSYPLMLCDWSTVRLADVEPYDKIHSDHVQEGAYLYKSDEHEWYWRSHQTNDEATLFVSWDADRTAGVSGCPHGAVSSFQDESPGGKPPRHSVEVRLIVISPRGQ